jgi:hypothetical protein
VTLTGEYDAPRGTVTVNVVGVAEETVARTAPKYTILSVRIELKLEPLIVTVDPIAPEPGETEEIMGTLAIADPPRKIKRLPMDKASLIRNSPCYDSRPNGRECALNFE